MIRSFYIHWPFCPYKCHFCPFVAFAGQDQFMTQYHTALTQEIIAFAAQQAEPITLDTIYFGGGTPSTYPDDLLLDMFGTLKKVSNFTAQTEITIEINPGTVTRHKLEHWKALGINRLSIGVQSLNEKVLKDVNRLQSNSDVRAVLDNAVGLFDNVSIDLILGLPNVTVQQWKEQLEQIVHWPITHIAVYFLTIHEFTPLYYRVKKKEIDLPYDDEVVDLYEWTVEHLAKYGFDQYEISNFARCGFESRHNSGYWQRKPYKGFGVGAWSFDGQYRLMNKRNLSLYMQSNAQDTIAFKEELTQQQAMLEEFMLALRQKKGLLQADYYKNMQDSQRSAMQDKIKQLEQQGLVKESNGRLQLTARGFALEQEVITRISP